MQVPYSSRIIYSRFAFHAFPASHPGRPSCRSFWCTTVFDLSLESVFFAPCHFCMVGQPLAGTQFLPWSALSLDLNIPEEVLFFHTTFAQGTPSCRRQMTSSWIHDIPRSFPSSSGGAPQPDCRPYAASSVLRPTFLRGLPWGSPATPLDSISSAIQEGPLSFHDGNLSWPSSS
jgi:hypothetical protein